VAFLARDLFVQSGQGVARLRMVKLGDHLPLAVVVALGAVRSEPSCVRVLMTTAAGRREPQVGAAHVPYPNGRALSDRNTLRFVALIAGEASVLAR